MPGGGTRKLQSGDYEFVKGWNSNLSNDAVPENQWRRVRDARQPELGKWDTRKGNDRFSVPIGEAVNAEQTSTSGAGNRQVSTTSWVAQKVTATATGPCTRIDVNVRNDDTGSGTLLVALCEDNSGTPGDLLLLTSIAQGSITDSYGYVSAYSITCPTITNSDDYWVVLYMQAGGTGYYEVSTTTAASTGLVSTNSGGTWGSATDASNIKLYSATAGGVKGCGRYQRPDGTIVTVFAHGTNLYSVDNSTGVATSIDSNLGGGSTYVGVAFVNDTLYYADGTQKPRKYNFSANSSVSGAIENAADVAEHKGLLFYVSAVDPTKFFFTNFAAYDTFTSTDYIYAPAPKTADPIQRLISLNGVLYIITRHSKFALLGSSNQDFRLEPAVGQKGAVGRRAVTHDENYIYIAADDGIYQYNGAEEKNIGQDILNLWRELDNKENTVMDVFGNRLYVWYTPNGETSNTECLVYNTLYNHWESLDSHTSIGGSLGADAFDESFVQASNRAGMLMWGERSANDHASMGEPMEYELLTSYWHAKTPAQWKRAPYFRPHFAGQPGTYEAQVGYDLDYANSPTYTAVQMQGTGSINPLDVLRIEGEWRRLQVRYKHHAARQPVSFDGHVLTVEAQRVI